MSRPISNNVFLDRVSGERLDVLAFKTYVYMSLSASWKLKSKKLGCMVIEAPLLEALISQLKKDLKRIKKPKTKGERIRHLKTDHTLKTESLNKPKQRKSK